MFSFKNNHFEAGLSQERTGRTRAETRAKQDVKAAFAHERTTATLAENENNSRAKSCILVAQIAEAIVLHCSENQLAGVSSDSKR
jgi:hypothetical protein